MERGQLPFDRIGRSFRESSRGAHAGARDVAGVNVFLTQNAVLAARRASKTNSCAALVTECIDVLADDFSLRERGIESQALLPGVKVASMEAVVARLAHGWKAFWS
jgi:intracellular sulfur oxidation DsrE/DsrF family protein